MVPWGVAEISAQNLPRGNGQDPDPDAMKNLGPVTCRYKRKSGRARPPREGEMGSGYLGDERPGNLAT